MKARLTVLAAAVAVSALFAGASPAGREPSCSDGLVSPSFGWATCDRRLFVTEDGRDWSDVTPPGLLWQVEDVLFLSHSRGWVAGNDCVRGKAYVYGTFDGGRTWRSSPVANVNCAAGSRLSLSFVDSRHGWYLQVFGNTFGMALAKTGDGGASWYGVAKELPIKGEISFRTRAEGW